MENPINIALVGPTCAGKTTCATRLRTHFNLRHLSTGLLLRENWASQNALGLLTRKHVERGELVPDEIINAMLEEAVRKMSNEQGLLLDGFPSTLYQALFLENLFRETGRALDAVVLLHVPDSAVFQRASRRVPVRPDDRPGILRRRLRVFRRTTGPVLEFYRRGQKLIFLEAAGSIESVSASLGGVLSRLYSENEMPVLTDKQGHTLDNILSEPVWQKAAGTQTGHDFIILGAPGSGKGTHAKFLSKFLGVPHVPTGNLFRDNLKEKTTLGRIAQTYVERGELVPDDVTEAMVRERLNHADLEDGFILDGFPRTLPQARALDDMLADMSRTLASAVHLSVPDDEIIRRISGRRFCPACQTTYHVDYNKPKQENVCDHDGTALILRDDDAPETVRARLRVFHGQTMPVIDYYREAGLLIEVPAIGEVQDVAELIATMMQPLKRTA